MFSGVTYAATLSFNSGDVDHTKSDNTKTTVQAALNELYTKADACSSTTSCLDRSLIVSSNYSGSLPPHNYTNFQSYSKTVKARDGYTFLGWSTTGYMTLSFNTDYTEAYLNMSQSDVSSRSGTATLLEYPACSN